ncbi:MAG: leucine-rich repeat protein [Oscillospiraceae bacterium]|nr:leucine-rich repeat protein [Oscillospiraceae bacterium]
MKTKQIIISRFLVFAILFALLPHLSLSAHAITYSGSYNGTITWTLNTATGVIVFEGSGSIGNSYDTMEDLPWLANFKDSYIKEIRVSEGITAIGDYAFRNCEALERVTLANSVSSIGYSSFAGCTALQSITMGSGLERIENTAFSRCSALETVSLPASLTSLSPYAFSNCDALRAINVDSGSNTYSSLNGVLFDRGQTELIKYPAGKQGTSYAIPDSVMKIGESAFYGCRSLTNVTIPDSVRYIGSSAFCQCSGLTEISIPNGITFINFSVFYDCTALARVTIPNSVNSIFDWAFNGCESLKSVCIPEQVQSIGFLAFGYIFSEANQEYNKMPDFTIYGAEGSAAQSYAVENGFSFISGPVITSQPVSASVLCGQTASFVVEASGEELSYQWMYRKPGAENWTVWTGKTTPMVEVKGTNVNNGFQYCCVVSNGAGSVSSSVVTLSVTPKPSILSQPASVQAAAGESVSFTVVASGNDLSYQWQYKKPGSNSWTNWSGKTAATASVKASASKNAYQYRCIVSNSSGSVSSEAATLTVVTVSKPAIVGQPSSVSVAPGATASFTVVASGDELSYQWQYKKPGSNSWRNWSGKTAATASVKATSAKNAYQYRCVVSNSGGSVYSNVVTLTVVTASKPVITSQPASVSVAPGASASFTVAATGDDLSYQWQYKKAGSNTWSNWSGKTTASVTVKASSSNNAFQYRCIVSNSAGSVTSSAASLTVTG